MTSSWTGDVERRLRHLFGPGSAIGLTDGQLLERFADRRGESDAQAREAAFETILDRHGAMVLTVCRQMLGEAHTAEDAFQATFLVMIRRAGSLRVRGNGSIGPWLHGVACRIARNERRATARRHAREQRAAVSESRAAEASRTSDRDDASALLHQEVDRLPAKYRDPVVLCYFEGRTHDEAAAALNWPVGTVRGRLARARDQLRARLTRRGLAPAISLEAIRERFLARAAVPSSLRDATFAAAIRGTPAARVTALAKLSARSWLAARVRMSAAFVLVPALLAAGAGLEGYGTRAFTPPQHPAPPPGPGLTNRRPLGPIDFRPAPLPRFARARLGTPEFLGEGEIHEVVYTADGKYLASWEAIGPNRIWDAATGRTVRTFLHSREISIAPDGTTSACLDQERGLWLEDPASGRERRRWHKISGEAYRGLTFSPDIRMLAAITRKSDDSGHPIDFITLWDTASPTEFRRRLRGDWYGVHRLKFSADGKDLIVVSDDWIPPQAGGFPAPAPAQCFVRIFDLDTCRERRRYPIQGVQTQSVIFSRDSSLLDATDTDQAIRLVEVATGRRRGPSLIHNHRLRPGNDPVDRAYAADSGAPREFSPDGSILASGSFVGSSVGRRLAPIHLWDVARGEELRHFPAPPALVRSISFAPDGKTIASGGGDRVIRFWDVATGRERFPHVGHQAGLWTLAISPADGTVYTGGADRTIHRWDPVSGRDLGIFARFRLPVMRMAFSPDGKNVLVGRYGQVAIWSVSERREIRDLTSHEIMSLSCDLAYSPDGKTVIAEGRVWDVASGEAVMTLRSHRPATPTGTLSYGFPTVGFGKPAAVPDQARPEKPILDRSPIYYAPDGERIITTEPEGIRIWDLASKKEIGWAVRSPLYENDNNQHHVALSPDGHLIAVCLEGNRNEKGKRDRIIQVWELASGREVMTLKSHQETGLQSLAFSPDGRLLASGGESDAKVRVWDLATGRELRSLTGHLAGVTAVAFSADSRSVISGSADATAIVWDVSDLAEHLRAAEPLTSKTIKPP
jgi:RNA polymerase sigma factor (sigma-70 family)